MGAAVSQGRDQIRWRVGDPGPTPEPLGIALGLNLGPRHTDNADADLCPYQPLIPMEILSPCVMFVPLSGGTLAPRLCHVKS